MQTISSQPYGYPDPRGFFFGPGPVIPPTKPPGGTEPDTEPPPQPAPTEPATSEVRFRAS
jgi:hypothetical protein